MQTIAECYNKVKKDCSVIVELEEGGKVYRIERYRKHSKKKNNIYLYINDTDSRGKDNRETQEYIEKILSIDKLSFANSIVFGQGYSKNLRRFSELTDKEQKECLESILDVEVFSIAHSEVMKEIKGLLGIKDTEERKRGILLGALEDEKRNLEETQSNYESFDLDKAKRVAATRSRYDGVLEEIRDLEAQVLALPKARSESEVVEAINEYKKELRVYRDRGIKLKDKYDESNNKLLVIKNGLLKEISSAQVLISKLSDGSDEGEECSYCGALVSEERVLNKKGGIEFDISDKERTIKLLEKDINSLYKKYKKKVDEIDEVLDMIEEVLSNLSDERQQIFSLKLALEKIESKLEYSRSISSNYLEQIERSELEKNPYEALIGKLNSSIEKKVEELEGVERECDRIDQELEYYKFWKNGFSREGIRSYLLDKAIPFLTERANNYLGILTDGGIGVRFNARKQLASGEWRESFNVEVINANASETYEGNSGGEKRRIDLAISLAINDFIASRSGKRLNILLLDEVFENIDETGVYYVVKVLEELAQNRSSVFVITHQDSLSSYFNETIKLVRQGGLSYVH